jgi:hypothetical protein
VRGRDRLTTWDGSLEISDGRIEAAEPFAMENPEKGITARAARRIEWVSNTTGDDDGVDITVSAPGLGHPALPHARHPRSTSRWPISPTARRRSSPPAAVDLRAFMRRLPARDLTRE